MAATHPEAEYTQEVRFAVVMYGGVSLAIYINGVAQELLRMVRATARAGKDDRGEPTCLSGATTDSSKNELKGTERVYRKLSYLLADKQLLAECRELAKNEKKSDPPNGLSKKLEDLVAANERPINVKFVVDILSGTSAGGINAIYLGKALANDQSIDQLKQLWIDEGDLALLINDKRSVTGLNLEAQSPPQSLLNSRRMYLKLLKSLNDMEVLNPSKKNFDSPYVEEIDLFITTTDIAGIPVPIRLSDTVVFERRHRNVFHFKYASSDSTGAECNDFAAENDPFLAFAARCTSSFPFAFEPMRLCDIDEVLDTFKLYQGKDKKELKKSWQRFFKEKTIVTSNSDFEKKAFGDGGYLDNKPFTYATETLARRYAALPVDRKLIYIEPSPEHPEDALPDTPKPDALQNVKAALIDLPAYETIREDLQRLLQRNVLLSRINRITSAVDNDLDMSTDKRPELQPGEWETLDLAGLCDKFGVYYLPYRRLRIAAVTDRLAELIARIFRMEENSAAFYAVRVLIQAWRQLKYPDYHRQKDEPAVSDSTENAPAAPISDEEKRRKEEESYTASQLLIHYDFDYWLRRLNFIRRKVDLLYRLKDFEPPTRQDNVEPDLTDEERAMRRFTLLRYNRFDYTKLSDEQKLSIHQLVLFLRSELRLIYKNLRVAGRRIQAPYKEGAGSEQTLAWKIKQISLPPERIRHLLGMREQTSDTEPDFSELDQSECLERAKEVFRDEAFAETFQEAARALKDELLTTVVKPTWSRCRALFRATETLPEDSGSGLRPLTPNPHEMIWNGVREYLWRYFSQFDDFDQISFPIMYGIEEGESDVVDVIRISPEDATTLINERQEKRNSADGIGRRKLAGTALHHFGAFLDRTWRHNDIMWGRLDGAERLITALLPDPDDKPVRAELIREAHNSILIDELPRQHRLELATLMSNALVRASAGEPIEASIKKVLQDLKTESSVRKRLERVMCNSLEDKELLRFIAAGYEVNRRVDAKMMLRSISRSTQVIGKLFEDIANQNSLDGKSLAWIARLGQVFWGLVEVAVPNSILNLLMMHWLKVLYVLELLLLLISFVFSAPDEVKDFALRTLAVTVLINMAVLLLRDKMRGRRGWLYGVALTLVGAVFILAGIGAADLLGYQWSTTLLDWIKEAFDWLKRLG